MAWVAGIPVPGICWGRGGKFLKRFLKSFWKIFLAREKFWEIIWDCGRESGKDFRKIF